MTTATTTMMTTDATEAEPEEVSLLHKHINTHTRTHTRAHTQPRTHAHTHTHTCTQVFRVAFSSQSHKAVVFLEAGAKRFTLSFT